MSNRPSRRTILRAAGVGAIGVSGMAILAACGESEPEPAPAAPAAAPAPAATAAPAPAATPAPAAAAPQPETVTLSYVGDHTSGPRGAAMQWGLKQYAALRPNIFVKFIPQPADYATSVFPLQMAAGTQAEVAMLDGGMLGAFVNDGGFTEINDGLSKRDDYNAADYYFIPDLYTVNHDHAHGEGSNPSNVIEGAQFGIPFQGALGGIVMNTTMGEAAGVEFPSEGWTYENEFLESCKQVTDPDTDQWGTWAHNGYEFHWSPMAFMSGAKAMRNADETELAVFDDGGDFGLNFSVGLIHNEKVSFPLADNKRLAGEFGNPFAAGKVWSWLSSVVYTTGYHVPRIKDRFKWSLGPMPLGSLGEEIHEWNDQPHLVTNGAQRYGTIEEAIDLILFLGGPTYQGRVAIDRGHLPMHRGVFDSDEAKAPPPEGMHWLKHYADVDNVNRHLMMALPAWWEMYEWRKTPDAAYLGDKPVAQVIDEAKHLVRTTLASQRDQLNEGRKKFGFPPL